MNSTPEVIVKNKYTPSYNNLNFTYSTKQSVHNSTMNMFDYYADVKKKAYKMFDYFSGNIGKEKEMNIIFEDGKFATQKQINLRKKEYEKYIENSNIYKLVISFPEDYLEENVDIEKFELALAKNIIPMFLHKCGFVDIKKMSYQFALHTDTDNLHFHLSFCEKEPNYKSYGKQIKYRFNGELTQEECGFLKNEILHYINKEKIFTPLLIETNKEIDGLKKYFSKNNINFLINRNEILLEEKFDELSGLLEEKNMYRNNRIKFNSIKDKSIVKLTKDIKKIMYEDDEFKQDYECFKNTLDQINDYFESLSKSNHIKEIDISLINNKEKYLDNYVLNAIINHANNMRYMTKISEEELLQSLISKNKNNYKIDKYNILLNLLSKNNMRTRYKINNAVKSINEEMDEAAKEFDKLFKSDDYML